MDIIILILISLVIFLIYLTRKDSLTCGTVLAIKENCCYIKSDTLNKIIKCKYNKTINIGDHISAIRYLFNWYIV